MLKYLFLLFWLRLGWLEKAGIKLTQVSSKVKLMLKLRLAIFVYFSAYEIAQKLLYVLFPESIVFGFRFKILQDISIYSEKFKCVCL